MVKLRFAEGDHGALSCVKLIARIKALSWCSALVRLFRPVVEDGVSGPLCWVQDDKAGLGGCGWKLDFAEWYGSHFFFDPNTAKRTGGDMGGCWEARKVFSQAYGSVFWVREMWIKNAKVVHLDARGISLLFWGEF